jgi:hypothetical protein
MNTSTPYTPQQVIHNLQNMIEQLRAHPANLEGGPGWCRHQAKSILARGIVGDHQHSQDAQPPPMKTNKQLLDIAEAAIRELLHRHDYELEGMPRAHSHHAIAHIREAQRALDGHPDVMPPLQTAKLTAALA